MNAPSTATPVDYEVVAARLRPHDRLVDATRARLEDAPVEVDHEVVADVVPAAARSGGRRRSRAASPAPRRRCSRWGSRCGARTPSAQRRRRARPRRGDPLRPARDERGSAAGPAPRRARALPAAAPRRVPRGRGSSAWRARPHAFAHVDQVHAHVAEGAARAAQLHGGACRPSTAGRPRSSSESAARRRAVCRGRRRAPTRSSRRRVGGSAARTWAERARESSTRGGRRCGRARWSLRCRAATRSSVGRAPVRWDGRARPARRRARARGRLRRLRRRAAATCGASGRPHQRTPTPARREGRAALARELTHARARAGLAGRLQRLLSRTMR